MAEQAPSSRSRSDCLAAADALYGAAQIVDDIEAAETLVRLSDQWRVEAENARPDPWCPECFEAPEPDGPWAPPGDRCADEHVLPWALAHRSDEGAPGTALPAERGAP